MSLFNSNFNTSSYFSPPWENNNQTSYFFLTKNSLSESNIFHELIHCYREAPCLIFRCDFYHFVSNQLIHDTHESLLAAANSGSDDTQSANVYA